MAESIPRLPERPASPENGKRSLWQLLVEPASAVQETEAHRQARLLASLLALLTPLLAIGFVASSLSGSAAEQSTPVVLGVGALALGVAYSLSRSRHHRLGAVLALAIFSALPFAALLSMGSRDTLSLTISLIWIALPLLLSSVLLPLGGITILAAANTLGLLLMPVLIPRAGFAEIAPLLGYILVVSTLLLISTHHRNLLEKERQQELLDSNRQLQAAQATLQERNDQLRATVQQYADHMAVVGRGDLSARLRLHGDELEDPLVMLGHRLNETTAQLQATILQVRQAATDLASAASEILASITQQATGASEQSAAIAQASTTKVRTIAEQTAQRAKLIAGLVQHTTEVSQSGQQAVADTIQGMAEIKHKVETIATNVLALAEQAQSIGGIIATVNQFASQSNMLALNAAVEAARAGEAGRGFTVVAGEVRSLASQSRAATEQVRDMLTEIQRSVDASVMATEEGMKGTDVRTRLSGQAGLALQRLDESISASTQSAAQIAAAAGQQVTGIEQVALAMEHINQVTAQSVAGVQQVERAAGELHTLAGLLRELVEQYQL